MEHDSIAWEILNHVPALSPDEAAEYRIRRVEERAAVDAARAQNEAVRRAADAERVEWCRARDAEAERHDAAQRAQRSAEAAAAKEADLIIRQAVDDQLAAERVQQAQSHEADWARRAEEWYAEPGCTDYRIHRFVIDLEIDGGSQVECGAVPDATLGGVADTAKAFAPYVAHFSSIGAIRADGTAGVFLGQKNDDAQAPTFYLIIRGANGPDPAGLTPAATSSVDKSLLTTIKCGCTADGSITGLFDSLAARDADDSIGRWGGDGTPELLPQQGEPLTEWLDRVSVPAGRLSRSLRRWERSGEDMALFARCGSASERAAGGQPIRWVVPGLYARGTVSSLTGSRGAGKSTLAGEMAAVLDSESDGPRSVLGIDIVGSFVVAVVSGEEADSFVDARAKFYEPIHGEPMGFVIDGSAMSLENIIALLRKAPLLDFVIFDPVRKFLVGDEDSSSGTSLFYDQLDALARDKDCAVLAVHHLTKGSPPRSMADVPVRVRGSGVHMDRPRMVTAVIDRGHGVSGFGIVKNNFPPSETLWGKLNEERRFRRDAETLTLVPLVAGETAPSRSEASTASEFHPAILKAIGALGAAGRTVRRTGPRELFRLQLPELDGASRATLRDAVARLVTAGKLSDTPDGLKAVS